ncbi:AfsR/SARP family transcriptional regulator [Lentzea guizhouensis]|uniref:AfsR/SARP family transcriptional regulator n=1 Tax=Lentzea guizhouensis TaxID=1586287 RepID=UPI0014736166|nr:BTAD domain-containing putative transcriptional regulator [Lentzea guizhouensis]
MRFTVFGGVGAWVADREVDLGQAQRRAVLGVLLVTPGVAVGADELVDRVWGAAAPERARGQLRTWLWRLRQAVPGVISREGSGYVARVDPLSVDLHRFRALAATDPGAALALAQEPLLSTLDTPWARQLRASFAAEFEAVRRDHVDARLQAGGHAELVDELRLQASGQPLDERVAAQLVEALHGTGRTQEALAHLDSVVARLASELGAEPGGLLTTVRRRLLAARGSCPRPKPFTGRAAELAALDRAPAGSW